MLFNSSFDGKVCAPDGNTKLIGSNKRESDLDKYAFSNVINESFSITLGLKSKYIHDITDKFQNQSFQEKAARNCARMPAFIADFL